MFLFQYRVQFFANKMAPKPKSIKRLIKTFDRKKEDKSSKNVQETGFFDTCSTLLSEKTENACNICFLNNKNAVFNHGKSGHVYCCYTCAKQVWSKSGKCPICNAKIRYVTKIIK